MSVEIKRKILIPVLVLVAFVLLALVIINNPPKAKRFHSAGKPQLTVSTLRLSEAPYQVQLQSYGMVRPRIESQLVAQVSGQIIEVSPQFRNGGFFEKGDVLVRIDDRDYQAEVNIGEAALINARQNLVEEQARAEQALEDWQRLGNDREAPALVLRKPQLKAAEAQVMSAQSTLDKAQLNLERTEIVAPFAGRILSKEVDVGEVVSTNRELAAIYAIDYIEIRLPIKNSDLSYMRLPEDLRFSAAKGSESVRVVVRSKLVQAQAWQGEIIRTEGAIDGSSRQLHVVAQVMDPYGIQAKDKIPLKIGEYVTAEIEGMRLPSALVIPNRSIYQGSYVYLVVEDRLLRREIEIAWQNEREAIIKSGLKADDELVLTPLGQVTSGVAVKVANGSDDVTEPGVARLAEEESAQ